MKIDQDNKPFTPVKSVNVNEDKTSVTIQWSDAVRPANFHAVLVEMAVLVSRVSRSTVQTTFVFQAGIRLLHP